MKIVIGDNFLLPVTERIVHLQATGEDYNVEEGEGKRPFRALLDVGLVRTTTGNRVFGALKVMSSAAQALALQFPIMDI